MEINSRIQNFFNKVIMLVTCILTFLVGFNAIRKTVFFNLVINFASEQCMFKNDNILINLILVILVLGILYFLYKKVLSKLNTKILLIVALTFSLLIGFWWINYLKLEPVADQYMVFYCADKLIENDLKPILDKGNYLSRNPHQLGFVLYIELIFTVFNTFNVIFVQNFVVIFSAIALFTMYLIVKEIFEEDIIHKIALIFIAFFSIYFMFFSAHVYGNLPGLAFALIAILFTLRFINSNKFYNLIITAISITLAYLLKSNYEIFLIAIVIILALKAVQDFKIEPFTELIKGISCKTVIGIFCILVTVFGVKSIVYTCFENATGYKLNNGVPMLAYIYMGIAEPQTLTPGWYTGDVEGIYNKSDCNKEKATELTKELLSNRLDYLAKNLDYTFGYFQSKLETTWLNPTFQTIWCSTPGIVLDQDPDYNSYIAPKQLLISIVCGKAFSVEERAMDTFQILVFLSASFGFALTFKNEKDLKKMLLPIIFLGGFTFHLIWETKAIYVLPYFYLLIPYASFGIYNLFKLIDKKIKDR